MFLLQELLRRIYKCCMKISIQYNFSNIGITSKWNQRWALFLKNLFGESNLLIFTTGLAKFSLHLQSVGQRNKTEKHRIPASMY